MDNLKDAGKNTHRITLEALGPALTVCKVADFSQVDLSVPLTFAGTTDHERSLVCPTAAVPANTTAREDGWRAMRVAGSMDFGLVGVLTGMSGALAKAGVANYAVSTYDTDYVLTKAADFPRALEALREAGYEVVHSPTATN